MVPRSLLPAALRRLARLLMPLALLPATSCIQAEPMRVGRTILVSAEQPMPLPPAAAASLDPAMSPTRALVLNAAIPLMIGPNPPAFPFVLRGSGTTQARALNCLATAIYYEAASESIDGQRAVAQVVLNRVRHPAYPRSVCGVVFEGAERATGCQFSFTCDGAMARGRSLAGWRTALRVAAEALAGRVFEPVGLSTHYHTLAVSPPWARRYDKIALVGAHIFYRLDGGWGEPRSFDAGYAGAEPAPWTPRRDTPIYASAQNGAPPAPSALPAAAQASQLARADTLPESRIRPEYRRSGSVRAEYRLR